MLGFGDPGFFRFPDVLNNARHAPVGYAIILHRESAGQKRPVQHPVEFVGRTEISRNTALRVSYIANRANQLTWSPNLNQPLPITGLTTSATPIRTISSLE